MKTYEMCITQKLSCSILVEAESEEEAKEIIYNNLYGEVIDNALNYDCIDFEITKEIDTTKLSQYFVMNKSGKMERKIQKLKVTSSV